MTLQRRNLRNYILIFIKHYSGGGGGGGLGILNNLRNVPHTIPGSEYSIDHYLTYRYDPLHGNCYLPFLPLLKIHLCFCQSS